jgi:hypothetical protein
MGVLSGIARSLASVREATAGKFWVGGEAAIAAVGEFLGEEVEWGGGTCVRHNGKV